MFAKLLPVLVMVGLSTAANLRYENNKPKAGVDPNSVHCDPEGQIFLLLPDTKDCSIFFMCTHGKEVRFDCPGGTIFDFELQGCDWPSSGNCILRSSKDDEIEGSGDEDEEASGFWQPEESESFAAVSDLEETERSLKFAGVLDCKNPSSASRHAAYKGDCQRYWRCVDGAIQAAYCTDGLFFNAQTQQCDFEANSKCVTEIENELEGEYIVYK